jgi:hypothetical protein
MIKKTAQITFSIIFLFASIGIAGWITSQEMKKNGKQDVQKTENSAPQEDENADAELADIKNKDEASQALADVDNLMAKISEDNLQDN